MANFLIVDALRFSFFPEVLFSKSPQAWSGMGWSGIMEWNGVEWILVEDAFWSFWVILTLLVILGPNLVVFASKT